MKREDMEQTIRRVKRVLRTKSLASRKVVEAEEKLQKALKCVTEACQVPSVDGHQ